jgi:hypothetical protein
VSRLSRKTNRGLADIDEVIPAVRVSHRSEAERKLRNIRERDDEWANPLLP